MSIAIASLPKTPAIGRIRDADGRAKLVLCRRRRLLDLTEAEDPALHSLDRLLMLPLDRVRGMLDDAALDALPELQPQVCSWLAPVDGQEVWAAGVTYLRSREARMEEAVTSDVYAMVYGAERPEIFFKAAGWRVIAHGGEVGIRPDSDWDVPEPELAVLSNASGEVVAYTVGNDMSSRSIEGENPLYLPQAKVYDASCALGPTAVLAWHIQVSAEAVLMRIERDGETVFSGSASLADMVREPESLSAVVHTAYTLPVGLWLLTGTSIVPPLPYTAEDGDVITVSIASVGELQNTVRRLTGRVAKAPPRLRRMTESSP